MFFPEVLFKIRSLLEAAKLKKLRRKKKQAKENFIFNTSFLVHMNVIRMYEMDKWEKTVPYSLFLFIYRTEDIFMLPQLIIWHMQTAFYSGEKIHRHLAFP